ncbi:hypothetical protein EV658_1252 [Phaeovulum veldkampii DSM 11550]|nr:hypothetical protein EV658_1252 [Phaeovulum veldkampii DSM 11550]
MSDPFSNYTILARGGVPATPPQPAQPDHAPRTAVVDGIKVSADRLEVLDRLARTHKATQAGLADRVADLRADRQDHGGGPAWGHSTAFAANRRCGLHHGPSPGLYHCQQRGQRVCPFVAR